MLYRDLKPENVLINEDGYISLIDFSLATNIEKHGLANSFCGTAEYLAPEMLAGSGHDHTVDWWCLGILVYEMVVGIPPFFHKNKHRMYHLIKSASITYPDPVKHKIDTSADFRAFTTAVSLLFKSFCDGYVFLLDVYQGQEKPSWGGRQRRDPCSSLVLRCQHR